MSRIPEGYSGGLSSFALVDEGWSSRERTTRFPPDRDFVPPALMLAETLGGTTYLGPRCAAIKLASEPLGGVRMISMTVVGATPLPSSISASCLLRASRKP